MTTKATKKLLALALSLALLAGMFPSAAFAAADGPPEPDSGVMCENHPEHTGECGYVAAVEGAPCKHIEAGEHDESCGYAEGTPEAPCGHIHDEDCGYVEAVEGQPCGHVCELCAQQDSGPIPGTSGQTVQTSCTRTEGCTQPDGHEGGCVTAPPTNAVTISIAKDESGPIPLYLPEGVPVSEADLLADVFATDENGNDLPVAVSDVGGLDLQNPQRQDGSVFPPQSYTITYEAAHPDDPAVTAAATREAFVTAGIMPMSNDTTLWDGAAPNISAWTGGGNTITVQSGANDVLTIPAGVTELTITGDGGVVEFTGSIQFASGRSGDITLNLDNLTINAYSPYGAVYKRADAGHNLILNISGTVTLKGQDNALGDGYALWTASGNVTINGPGTLRATGGNNSSSSDGVFVDSGDLIVHVGCTLYATGSSGIAVNGTLDNSGTVFAQGGNNGTSPGDGISATVMNRSGGVITATGGDGIGNREGGNGVNAGSTSTITNESGGTIIATGGKGSGSGAGGHGVSAYNGNITNSGAMTGTGGTGGDNGGAGGIGVRTGVGGNIINNSGGVITATGGQGGAGSGNGGAGVSAGGSGNIINNADPGDFTATGGDGGSPSGTDGAALNKAPSTGSVTTQVKWGGQSDKKASDLGVQSGGTVTITGGNSGGGATLTVDVENITVTSGGQAVSGVCIEAGSGIANLTIRDLSLTAQEGKIAIYFSEAGKLTVQGACNLTGGRGAAAGYGAISGEADLTVEVGTASLTAIGGECTATYSGGYGIWAYSSALTVNISDGGALTARGGDSQERGGSGLVGETVTIENHGTVVAEGGKANGGLSGRGIGSNTDMTLTGAGTITARGSNGIMLYDGGTLKVDGTVLAEGDHGIAFGYTNLSPSALTGSGSLRAIGGADYGNGIHATSLTLRFTGDLTAHGGSGAQGHGLFVLDDLTVDQAPASLDLRPGPNGHAIRLLGSFVNNSGIPDGVFVTGGTRPVLWPAHLVTVNGGAGGGYYGPGETVGISTTVPGGQRFTGWTISPDVAFTQGGANTETATFTMPAQAVTATAHYETVHSSGGSSSPSYYRRTLTDKASGVKVTGGSIHEYAALTVKAGELHSAGDAGCDLLRAAREAGHLLGAWDVSLSRGFRGSITVSLPVEGRDGQTLTVAHCVGGKLTLSNVKVSGGFAAVETDTLSPFAVLDGAYTQAELEALAAPSLDNPFTDVKESDWFYEAVMYVYHRGIMSGTSQTTFTPYGDTTRAQLAAILWRMEDTPAPTGGASFTDVPAGQYYTEAVAWCAEAGLMDGYGGGLFGPLDPITREQLAAALYRYAGYKGWDVSVGESTNILSFTDAFDVSEWAIPAVQWACGAGIMSGTTDGRLNPQGKATRAEIAAMLMRLLEKYDPQQKTNPNTGAGGSVTPNPGTGVSSSPKTGDSSTGAGWLLAALPASAAGAALCARALRRKRRDEEGEPDPTHA